tara:strand:- start:6971 stop:8236 length:1266 start_codon:yes stop_codon:yes gene_type:complete
MNSLYKIASKSLLNRKNTTILTIISIALSVCLLLGIERIRSGTKNSFENTVSGVDLIVGARSGPINLLLYSVFRIGNATNNLGYETYQKVKSREDVQYSIPISLGDSHRGYKVVGTSQNYFQHYQYGNKQNLAFSKGQEFQDLFDVVIGSKVAEELNYDLDKKITLSHGMNAVSFQQHDNMQFRIVGILKPTGTPVDSSLHVSLQAIEALHVDWQDGAPPRAGEATPKESLRSMDLTPSSITAFFVKLKSRMAVFQVQRDINEYADEAMLAILPGVVLRELWSSIGMAEKALFVVSILVFIVSLFGMLISLLSTLNERRREMALLRSVGASKPFIFALLLAESFLISIAGIVFGIVLLYAGLLSTQTWLEARIGMGVSLYQFQLQDFYYLALILVASMVVSLFPALRAYKKSLADGLTVRT